MKTYHTPPSEAAFTLMELMTVLAIISVIGGLGAGAFYSARRNYALQGTAGEIQGVLRAARNSALTTGSPAFVEVDPSQRLIRAYLFEPIGEWNFDTPKVEGGLRVERAQVTGAQGAPGRLGDGLDFRSEGGYVSCGAEARFDLRACVRIQAWVKHFEYPEVRELEESPRSRSRSRSRARSRARTRRSGSGTTAEGQGVILSKPGSYTLAMTTGGRLVGSIGDFEARTIASVVEPGRWVHVSLRYDGRSMELSADGVPRLWRPGTGTAALRNDSAAQLRRGSQLKRGRDPEVPKVAPVSASQVTISSGAEPFPGLIDEVRLDGAVAPMEFRYADSEAILGWKKYLHFNDRGHLDARYHIRPVRLTLLELPELPSPSGTEMIVDYSVTFDEWLTRWKTPPPDMTEAAEEAKLSTRYPNAKKILIGVDRLGSVSSEVLDG